MLVVVVLLPLSLPMYDGGFDHGGGGGGCGGPAAAAAAVAVAVEAVEDNLSAKAAGNESVDGRMTACDDEIGRWTTLQQPTNKRRQWRWQRRWWQRDSARSAAAWQWSGGSGSAAAAARPLRRWRQRESATSAAAWRQCGGGGSATLQRWGQLGGGAAAAAHSATMAARWQQRSGCGGGGSATSWRQRHLAAARWRRTAQRRQAMDWARARAIDGVTVTMTLWRRNAQLWRNGNRPVIFDDIEIEEEAATTTLKMPIFESMLNIE
jgi:hypothetical protein